jgi:glycerophosphoryl diester phosphodiesterase
VSTPRPLIIAHRGASGYRPEHTGAAYALALSLGADAVEPDIVASKDGVLVVRHENDISWTTNVADRDEFSDRLTTKVIDGEALTGWFTEDFTWAELSTLRARERLPELRPASAEFNDRYPILRLADVLAILQDANVSSPRTVRVVAEFKHATYFESIGLPLHELFVSELAAAGIVPSENWLTVESFEMTFLRKIRAAGVHAKRVYLAQASGAAFDRVARDGSAAVTYAEELTPAGLAGLAATGGVAPAGVPTPPVHGISVHKSLIVDDPDAGRRLVESAHAQGLEVFCWTFRPENEFLSPRYRHGAPRGFGNWRDEFHCILDTGVDGVFTDYPDLACDARDALVSRT